MRFMAVNLHLAATSLNGFDFSKVSDARSIRVTHVKMSQNNYRAAVRKERQETCRGFQHSPNFVWTCPKFREFHQTSPDGGAANSPHATTGQMPGVRQFGKCIARFASCSVCLPLC